MTKKSFAVSIKQLKVSFPQPLPVSYPIWLGSGLLENIALWLPKDITKENFLVIVTDDRVAILYAAKLEAALKQQGYQTLVLVFSAGESSKNNETKWMLEEKMLAHGCSRQSIILALGGGVVGDLAGFVAATYLRGIAYIQMPSTLLAMLDSSVGGKTGIDTPYGKNLIGSFWQPLTVVADLELLQTLSQEQLINGLIEAVKMFLTCDACALAELEKNLDQILQRDEMVLRNLVARAVAIKSSVVAQDERENGRRAILNFGHTIGHALEKLTDYQLLHGYAVALGILVEAKIAQLSGFLEEKHYLFIKTLLDRLAIRPNALKKFDIQAMIDATQTDKKNRAGRVHYVLLNDLGRVYIKDNVKEKQFVHSVPDEVVRNAFLDVIESKKEQG